MIQYYLYASLSLAVAWIFVIVMLNATEKHGSTRVFDIILTGFKNIIFFVVVGNIIWGSSMVFSTTSDAVSMAIKTQAEKLIALNVIMFGMLILIYIIQVIYQIVMLFWNYIKMTYGE